MPVQTWDRFLADIEADVRFGKSMDIALIIAKSVVVYEQGEFLRSTQLPAPSTSSDISDAIGTVVVAKSNHLF